MKFFKNNAYPEVNLHDCHFKIEVCDGNIRFLFPEGVGLVSGDQLNWCKKGMIQLSDCSLEDLEIFSVKWSSRFGKLRKVSREISLRDLNVLFERGGCLELWDEYYSDSRFLWKCAIYPYTENKKFQRKYGEIEIGAFTESPMEYYLEI